MRAILTWAAPAILVAASLAPAGPAAAGSLEISPITLQMIGKERTTTLRVRNTEAQPITLQIRAVDWTQADGADVYAPSTTLAVSPPTFVLKPGEAQTARMVVEGVTGLTTERAYRLIIDQIPESDLTGQAGVLVPIRVLLPVFLTPSAGARPKLSWSLGASGSSTVLVARNVGDARERVTALRATSGATDVSGGQPLDGYVLAGASRSWPLDATPPTARVSVSGEGLFTAIKADIGP